MARFFTLGETNRWAIAGSMAVVLAFLVFGWLSLASITTLDWGSGIERTRLWLVAAVVLLIVMSLLLVGTGWSAFRGPPGRGVERFDLADTLHHCNVNRHGRPAPAPDDGTLATRAAMEIFFFFVLLATFRRISSRRTRRRGLPEFHRQGLAQAGRAG